MAGGMVVHPLFAPGTDADFPGFIGDVQSQPILGEMNGDHMCRLTTGSGPVSEDTGLQQW